MNEPNLGQKPTIEHRRDAIHVAVIPVTAACQLVPGQRVVVHDLGAFARSHEQDYDGLVDPFLSSPVEENARFWLFLKPKSITSLRHCWSHPKFPNEAEGSSVSERWLRAFAESVGLAYSELMEGAYAWIENQDYLCRGGLLEGKSVPEEFWTHYEAVTGRHGEGGFFSCSC